MKPLDHVRLVIDYKGLPAETEGTIVLDNVVPLAAYLPALALPDLAPLLLLMGFRRQSGQPARRSLPCFR